MWCSGRPTGSVFGFERGLLSVKKMWTLALPILGKSGKKCTARLFFPGEAKGGSACVSVVLIKILGSVYYPYGIPNMSTKDWNPRLKKIRSNWFKNWVEFSQKRDPSQVDPFWGW